MLFSMALTLMLGCNGKTLNKPPKCPPWTKAEARAYREAYNYSQGGIEGHHHEELYPIINRGKRMRRHCEAIDVLRE